MSPKNKKTTVYLDPELHQALRLKAVTISQSVSELVNAAVRQALAEDAEDIAAFQARDGEPVISYGDMVKRMT